MKLRTILIADDESHIRNVVSHKLAQAGYRVLTASDGLEALELARRERPDLIITDYHMPGLSGLELCQRLRQSPQTASVPAILLTARGYRLELAEMERNGIITMVSKPFSPRRLIVAVSELLEAVPA